MNGKDSMMQAGSTFLPCTSKTRLQRCHRKEADPKARDRLLAFIMRKDSLPTRRIATRLNRPYSTVRLWLLRAAQMGVLGRYDERRAGKPCRLSSKQLAQLRGELIAGPQQNGFESGVWTCRIAAEHVRRKYGVQRKERGMRDLLVRLGFSCKKPRTKTPQIGFKTGHDRI